MRTLRFILPLIILTGCTLVGAPRADRIPNDKAVDLGADRLPGTVGYQFATDYLTYAPDGQLVSTEQAITEFDLDVDEAGRQTLTVRSFELIDAQGARTSIPRLVGWQNSIDPQAEELLGIPHADFAGLQNDAGQPLAPEITHRVYNTFVDFYAFNNVFARPASEEGQDIGDLKTIGQVIEHYSSFSRPAVDLGETVAEGSYFQNGRVTLEWKGMSRVGGRDCALIGFDSGESDFHMVLTPMPGMDVTVNGGSQYWGDLYINRESLWLEKGTFIEIVLARIQLGDASTMDSVIKRIGQISVLDPQASQAGM